MVINWNHDFKPNQTFEPTQTKPMHKFAEGACLLALPLFMLALNWLFTKQQQELQWLIAEWHFVWLGGDFEIGEETIVGSLRTITKIPGWRGD